MKSACGARAWKLETKSATAASPRISGLCVLAMLTPRGAWSGTLRNAVKLSRREAMAAEPSLLRPRRLITALSPVNRKHRGFSLPSAGSAETDPTSLKPRPGIAPRRYKGTSSAFLSKPAAMPKGLSKQSLPPRSSWRSDGPDGEDEGLAGRRSQSTLETPVHAGSARSRNSCSLCATESARLCAVSGSNCITSGAMKVW
mmetsp:Transcript_91583/g.161471  ORF Transcript_91583/g.161471 Transcript_91583/m.161471 type:complete len:200 (+) Transcript_91583:578-1177(+)